MGRIVSQTVTWIATIVVIRLLAPEDYALVAISGLVIGFTELLRELGLGAAIVQRSDLDEEQMRTIFGLIIIVHIFLFLLIYSIAPVVAHFFEEDELIQIIRVAALQLPILIFAVIPNALMVRAMRFKWMSIIQASSTIAASLTTLTMAYNGFGVWSLIGGQFAATLTNAIGFLLGQPYLKWPSFSFKKIGGLVSYSSRVFGADLLYYFYTRADVVIVGKLLDATALGFYTVAYNLATLPMNKISGVLSSVGFPAYARIKHDIPEVKSKFLFTVEANSLIFFPVLWGISVVADDLVMVLLGSKWLSAIVVLQIITLIIPLQMTGPLARPALLGIGRADLFMSTIVTNAICVPIALAIGSFWGLQGVSAGWVLGFSLAYYLNLRRFLPAFQIRLIEFGRIMGPAAFMTLGMYAVVTGAKMTFLSELDPLHRLIWSVITGVIVYCSLLTTLSRPAFVRMLSFARR
ncbi:MAG TPA: lipopolysaccharide biosynthesis protein [Nitrosospira sp.]|nr:lipopolysaccharide biosynthesis protein [Nitrosospira sp.]